MLKSEWYQVSITFSLRIRLSAHLSMEKKSWDGVKHFNVTSLTMITWLLQSLSNTLNLETKCDVGQPLKVIYFASKNILLSRPVDWNSFGFTFRLAVSVQLLKPAATWKSLTLWKVDPRLIRKGSNSVCVSNSHYHFTSMQPRQSWLCHKSYPADKGKKQQAEKFQIVTRT